MDELKVDKKFKNSISLIYAPLNGNLLSLEELDDPMLAIKALGEGLAINPSNDVVVSPCKGVVKLIHSNKRTIIIRSEEGFDVLIKVGINNNELDSVMFNILTQVNTKVKIGDELIKFNKEALLNKGSNITSIVVINNLDNTTCKVALFNSVKEVIAAKDLLYVVGQKEIINSKDFKEYSEKHLNYSNENKSFKSNFTKEITILNKTGLHARPAAYLSNLAKKFACTIKLQKGDDIADAKSLIEILGLGINYNDRINLIVEGEGSSLALDELIEAFNSGLGEEIKDYKVEKIKNLQANYSENNKKEIEKDNSVLISKIKEQAKSIEINGITIYPSIVTGKAFLIKNEEISVIENSKLSKDEEYRRLQDAIAKVKAKINNYISEAKAQHKISKVEIFSAHLDVLDDDFLLKYTKEELNKGKTAEFAFKQAANKTCDILMKTNNLLLQERLSDIRDIEKSILMALSGKEFKELQIPENSIVIAEDLTPSKITAFNDNVRGVVLAKGSSTSHISIMMKNDGVPSLVSVGNAVLEVEEGTDIILDSKSNKIIINPSNEEKQSINLQIEKLQKSKEANLAKCKESTVTKDGVEIKVSGNVGALEQAIKAFERGAEGIGLVRSEFLFINTTVAPSEEEQYKAYQAICDAMNGKDVIVRTLDVGGDKPIPYMSLPSEENPIMGLRGVRNYNLNEDIFHQQIRAILRVKPTGICKIMIPMVSTIDEVRKVKEVIEKEKKALGVSEKIEVGIMVEVPSVALLSKQFAKEVDFFSIGTNDLTQYILAMDRGHDILTKHLNNLNPALLRAINFTCQGAKDSNIYVGVCGAMASELECIPILVGLGITSLGCSADLIPDVKALIRNLSYTKCKEIAEKSLDLVTQDEVKELVYKEFGKYL